MSDTTSPETPGASGRGGLRERKKARTRKSIQRQTLRLIEEHGFNETTVDMIADAAEISPSTFFRYFRNKEEAAIADYMNEDMFNEVLAAPPEYGLLKALQFGITHTVEGLTEEEWHYQQLRGQLLRENPDLQRGMMESMLQPFRYATVIAAQRLKVDEESLEARMYGGAIVGALIGLMLPDDGSQLPPSNASPEEATAVLSEGLRLLSKVLNLAPPDPA